MLPLTVKSGLKQLSLKQYQDVHMSCIAAIKENIHDPVPYFLLGVLASDHGNYEKAKELFSTAENHDPSDAYFPAYLAKTLSTLRRQNQALEVAQRACDLVGKDAFLLDTLGVVFSRAGAHDRAIPLFKKAVSLNSYDANMHYNLGASAQFVGDFEAASASYQNALAIDPDFYRAWASLVYLEKQKKGSESLQVLENLFKRNRDDGDAKLQLGHAIAKTYEDLGEFESSIEWLLKAKTDKRIELPYDRDEGADVFTAAKQTYSFKSAVESPSNGISEEVTPIFVMGLPRTGTTLVDRILSSHSKVRSGGELNVFAELIKKCAGTSSKLVLDAETLRSTKIKDLEHIGRDYLSSTVKLADNHPYMIDKMPLNFFYAGLIHKALPNARIIVLRRGAMDSCLSNFRQLFSTQYSFYNYTFDLEDTAWFYRQFDVLMRHWREVLPSDRFMEVRYEDIVVDQRNQTRDLLNFCALEWQEECMNFHLNEAPVSTASSVQVRQPLYSGSIGRWKKYGRRLDSLHHSLIDLEI